MDIIEKVFKNHHAYYKEIGIETIKQQAGQVEQVSSDYQGRVLFELLQNAFDKAEKRILVKVENDILYVANDGEKFSYAEKFDYQNGDNEKRMDFQSLCSISTSTKNINTSIGNKGVGFKSVFSIAKEGYVNIHTRSTIIKRDNTEVEENIHFSIYDSFKDESNIPSEIDSDLQEILKNQIQRIQTEWKDRGVPGYYYPIYKRNENADIDSLFEDGYVTIIEIPLKEKNTLKELIENIKKIHFEFIQLKQPKDFEVKFIFDGRITHKSVNVSQSKLCVAEITSDKFKAITIEAGVSIEKPKVAFCINKDTDGVLYNYLPTKRDSPLKYVDFHADFHTTVDRKSINFDEKIGAYNKALLRACLELYFVVLNNSLNLEDRVDLRLEYIDEKVVAYQITDFNWAFFNFRNYGLEFTIIRDILRIWNNSYLPASQLIAHLASKYFSGERTEKEHQSFFEISMGFILEFGRDDRQDHKWLDYFKAELASKLKNKQVEILPKVSISNDSELLYRKKADTTIELPEFLGINITDFEIKDEAFRKALKIKEFNDYDEILKHFKQCSFSGGYSSEILTEAQQQKLLRALVQIFKAKKERNYLSTHRFTNIYHSLWRDSSLNQATFNIATIFLKTIEGRYKPAQLCTKQELDIEFFSEGLKFNQIDEFLRFLGVSVDSTYVFADIRIWGVLSQGLNFIPQLMKIQERIDKSLIENIHIISSKGRRIHPAIINDNYSFLENRIHEPKLKADFNNLLVGKYDNFPPEYLNKLEVRLEEHFSKTEDIIRLYQRLFTSISRKDKYLLIENNQLKWGNATSDFIILSNKSDFELALQIKNRKILCFYSGETFILDSLKSRIVKPKKGAISINNQEGNLALKQDINEKMIFLLLAISESKSSEINYLNDDNTHLEELRKKCYHLQIIEGLDLKQEVEFEKIAQKIKTDKKYCFEGSKLYFERDCSQKDKAEGICEYLFNNKTITPIIELILFHKELHTLKKEFDSKDMDIISQKWKSDYSEKFEKFSKQILEKFNLYTADFDEKWYCYSKSIRSPFLVEIDNLGRLEELKIYIDEVKRQEEYEGYFDSFELLIDYSSIWNLMAKPLSFLKSNHSKSGQVSFYTDAFNACKSKLGSESHIQSLIEKLKEEYSDFHTFDNNEAIKREVAIIKQDVDIEDIHSQIMKNGNKEVSNFCSNSDVVVQSIPLRTKKLIYQNGGLLSNNIDSEYLTQIGGNGEIEVLGLYIEQFLRLSIEERILGVNEVYTVLEKKLGNDSHKQFKDSCLAVIDDNSNLRKALISLFYVTKHHKFSYFDLIVYKNGKPILVEVKTTQNDSNGTFFMSSSELETARSEENYEIVRVTPSKIIFMDNPIKIVESKISEIVTQNYKITPKDYKFSFYQNG